MKNVGGENERSAKTLDQVCTPRSLLLPGEIYPETNGSCRSLEVLASNVDSWWFLAGRWWKMTETR